MTQMCSLTVLELRSPKSRCQQNFIPSGGCRKNSFSCFLQLLELPAFLDLWPCLPSSVIMLLSLALAPCLPHIRVFQIILAHLDNPRSPPPPPRSLISSAKSHLPCTVIHIPRFQGLGCARLWRDNILSTTLLKWKPLCEWGKRGGACPRGPAGWQLTCHQFSVITLGRRLPDPSSSHLLGLICFSLSIKDTFTSLPPPPAWNSGRPVSSYQSTIRDQNYPSSWRSMIVNFMCQPGSAVVPSRLIKLQSRSWFEGIFPVKLHLKQ